MLLLTKFVSIVLIILSFSSVAIADTRGIYTKSGFYACENDRLLIEAERYVDDEDQEALDKMYASDDCFTTDPGTQVFLVHGSFYDCTEGNLGDCTYLMFHPLEIRVKGFRKTWWTYRTFLKRSSKLEN